MPTPVAPKAVAVEVVAAQPTDTDRAALADLSTRAGATLPPVAYIVKVRLRSIPPPTSRGWALYVDDVRISKYWQYKDGIYFKVLDPQFFVDHQGERLRFSLDGSEFVDTGLRLSRPTAPARASRGRKSARRPVAAAALPLQEDVLK
jgi:hypothetical protein